MSQLLELDTLEAVSSMRQEIDEQDEDSKNHMFLVLVWSVAQLLDELQHTVEWGNDVVVVQLTGRLKAGGQRVQFNTYLGPSHPDDSRAARFEAFFHRALESSDLVIYNGHSGMGAYLAKDVFTRRLGALAPLEPPAGAPIAGQTLVLLSCFSHLYFASANFPLPSTRNATFVRDILTIGSTFIDVDLAAAASVVRVFSETLSSSEGLELSKVARGVGYQHLLLHQRVNAEGVKSD